MTAEKESALDLLIQLGEHEADAIANVWTAIRRGDFEVAAIEVEFLSKCHATRVRLLKAQVAAEAQRKITAEPPMIVSQEVN